MEVRDQSAQYDVPAAFKQTDVGMIPADWIVRSAKQIAEPVRGGSPRPAGDPRFFNGQFMPWLTVASLTNVPQSQLVVSETASSLTEEGTYYSRTLQPGTLIVANSGATLGVAKILGIKCCANDGIAALLRLDREVCPEYLAHFINTQTKTLREVVATGNGQPNLNTALIGELKLPLPPTRKEQQAIAEALSDTDALIESLSLLLTKKRHIKQGAMQELLTGKRRLPGFVSSWVPTNLGQLGLCVRGVAYDPTKDLSISDTQHTVRLLRSNNVYNGEILLTGLQFVDVGRVRADQYLQDGDLLICMANGSRELVGKTGRYVSKDEYRYTFGAFMGCYRPLSPIADCEFVSFLLQTHAFRQHVELLLAGSSINNLRPSGVLSFSADIPTDQKEQRAIAEVLSDATSEIVAVEERLAKALDVKKGMMQSLLTGCIRLVAPASNVISLPFKSAATHGPSTQPPHNWQISEAVVIAVLAQRFGTDQFPLPRKRRVKLMYLLHRHAEGKAEGYRKKAAGPYDPNTKYKGPEQIALKNGYVRALRNGNYAGFVAGDKIDQAQRYFEQWYGPAALEWLERFRYRKTDELEVLATVDMAMVDLAANGEPADLAGVKRIIAAHPEWVPKLSREVFSDDNIARTIDECAALFPA